MSKQNIKTGFVLSIKIQIKCFVVDVMHCFYVFFYLFFFVLTPASSPVISNQLSCYSHFNTYTYIWHMLSRLPLLLFIRCLYCKSSSNKHIYPKYERKNEIKYSNMATISNNKWNLHVSMKINICWFYYKELNFFMFWIGFIYIYITVSRW